MIARQNLSIIFEWPRTKAVPIFNISAHLWIERLEYYYTDEPNHIHHSDRETVVFVHFSLTLVSAHALLSFRESHTCFHYSDIISTIAVWIISTRCGWHLWLGFFLVFSLRCWLLWLALFVLLVCSIFLRWWNMCTKKAPTRSWSNSKKCNMNNCIFCKHTFDFMALKSSGVHCAKKGQHNNNKKNNNNANVHIVEFDFCSCIATCCLMYGCKNKVFFSQLCNRRVTNQPICFTWAYAYAYVFVVYSQSWKRCPMLSILLTGENWWAEKCW